MAQLVERVLGKDEVSGPNPDSSSRQPRRFTVGALVFLELLRVGRGETYALWGFTLNTPKGRSQSESGRYGSILSYRPVINFNFLIYTRIVDHTNETFIRSIRRPQGRFFLDTDFLLCYNTYR